jgi:hypothetical protein
MDRQDSLSNQLLIAMPGMADPNFNSTVTLVCEHNAWFVNTTPKVRLASSSTGR